MIISNPRWANAEHTLVTAEVDGATATFGAVAHNMHYAIITGSGMSVAPFVPEPPTFPTISPRQLRLALLETGTSGIQVDALLSAISDPDERDYAVIEWNHATAFGRDHPLIASLGSALGYTEEQIDTLWVWASTL